MSDMARTRAFKVVRAYPESRDADVREMPWPCERTPEAGEFCLPPGTPVIHLFSNILDVDGVDVANIAAVLNELRRYCPSTVIAVGPQNARMERILALYSMMKGEKFPPRNLVFGSIDFHNSYSRKTLCTSYGLSFCLSSKMAPLPVVSHRQTYRLGASVDAISDELREGLKAQSDDLDGAMKSLRVEVADCRAAAQSELAECKTLIRWLIGAVAVVGALVIFCR